MVKKCKMLLVIPDLKSCGNNKNCNCFLQIYLYIHASVNVFVCVCTDMCVPPGNLGTSYCCSTGTKFSGEMKITKMTVTVKFINVSEHSTAQGDTQYVTPLSDLTERKAAAWAQHSADFGEAMRVSGSGRKALTWPWAPEKLVCSWYLPSHQF